MLPLPSNKDEKEIRLKKIILFRNKEHVLLIQSKEAAVLCCGCASSSLEHGFDSWVDSQQYLAASLRSQSRPVLDSKVSEENVCYTSS